MHVVGGCFAARADHRRARRARSCWPKARARLRQQTDRAIIGLFGGNLLELGQWFYRNDNFFMLLAGEPERAHRFLDKLMEIHLRNLDRFLAHGRHRTSISSCSATTWGCSPGPQVSPAMYREYFQPRERAMWQMVKQRAPHLKILLHCCGGVRELLPDLIDAGLDAINPVQITCRGMDPAGLKRDFGAKLTFWGGGCDTRDILIKGTPAQVREHVRRRWISGGRAAVSSSSRCTTSWPMCRPRTSWRCMMPLMGFDPLQHFHSSTSHPDSRSAL